MKQLKIVIIVFLGLFAVYLGSLMWISISMGKGFVYQGHSGVKVGDIDVGEIRVGDIDAGEIRVGNADITWTAGSNFSLAFEKEVAAEEIRGLRIDYSMNSNDILIYQGDGDSVLIREYMNFTPGENDISTVELGDGQLRIKGKRRNSFFFLFGAQSKDGYTEIYLPAGFMENLQDFQAQTVSGEVLSEIPFVNCGSFSVSSTSGDIFFPGAVAEKINVSTTSGDIRLTAVSGNIQISTVSGDIMVDRGLSAAAFSTTSGDIWVGEADGDIKAGTTSGGVMMGRIDGDVSVNTTSGDIRAENMTGTFRLGSTSGEIVVEGEAVSGTASTVSGDIRIFTGELAGDLKLSTTSGSASIELPESASFALDFDSTSGECRTFFDEMLSFNKRGNKAQGKYGGGEYAVTFSTTSGDLRITKR
ncbi:MAG: DUF4097 domain-containing protein [Lachnospiraceae bacterium]|nr:DUF4097 domain-containing protein [Lachnospiraceae bacterium]